jgi:hypothetical protein
MITTDQIEQLKKRIAKVCDEFITGIEKPAEFIMGRMYQLKKHPKTYGIYYEQSNGKHCGFVDGQFCNDINMKRFESWQLPSPEEQLQIMTDYAVNVKGLKQGVKGETPLGSTFIVNPKHFKLQESSTFNLIQNCERTYRIIYRVCKGQWATPIPDKLIIQGHEVTKDGDYITLIRNESVFSFEWLKDLYKVLSKSSAKFIRFKSITLTTDEIKSIIEWNKW